MDRVSQSNSSVTTIAQTQTQHKKDYQKYFNYGASSQTREKDTLKVKPYYRAKTILVTAYFVAGFLIALFIANFIIISSMQNELNVSTQTYNEMVEQNQEYVQALNNAANSNSAAGEAMIAGYDAGVTAVYEYADQEQVEASTEDVQIQGNWYDRFIAFVSQVFGG